MSGIDFLAFLSFAFFATLGHCVGMCGGIVLSYSMKIKTNILLAHLLYAIGKMSTYMLLGAIAGGIGFAFNLNEKLNAILIIFLGTIMIAMGLSMFFEKKFLNVIEKTFARLFPAQRVFKYALKFENRISLFLLGVANGFLPCGIVYVALVSVASSGSIIFGALLMAIFGLCSMVPLFSFGVFSSYLNHGNWRLYFSRISACIVIVFGALFFYRASHIISHGNMMVHEHHIMQPETSKHNKHIHN